MAATTICTASNGWKFRPLQETSADQDFFMRCWKDFPQGTTTYIARLNRFSRMDCELLYTFYNNYLR